MTDPAIDTAVVNSIEALARSQGITRPRAELAQWVANLSSRAVIADELHGMAQDREFGGPIEQMPEWLDTVTTQLVRALDRKIEERDAARASLSALERELPPLREALEATNRRNAALEAADSGLRSELEAAQQRADRLQAALHKAEDELRILRRRGRE